MENCCNYVWNKRIYTTVFFWALDLYVNFIYTRHQYTRSLFLWALDFYVNFIYTRHQYTRSLFFWALDLYVNFIYTRHQYNISLFLWALDWYVNFIYIYHTLVQSSFEKQKFLLHWQRKLAFLFPYNRPI